MAGLVAFALVAAGCSPSSNSAERSNSRSRPDAKPSTGATTGSSLNPGGASYYQQVCDRDWRKRALSWKPSKVIKVQGSKPREASGLVADGHGGAWAIDDSGNPANLYRIAADGQVQTVEVQGVTNNDWEELLATPDADVAWIADTGDRGQRRSSAVLHRVELPRSGVDAVEPSRTISVSYGTESHDVEAGLVTQGSIWLFTKNTKRSTVLRVSLDQGNEVVAENVGEFTPPGPIKLVTGAALSPDGRTILLRTYLGAWAYPLAAGQSPLEALAGTKRCSVPTGVEIQGEAIAFNADGHGHMTIGEGENPSLSLFSPR